MDCIELDIEVIVADDALTPDQHVAQAQLADSALEHAGRPRPLRSLAEAMQLVNRDLGIFDAHVNAYYEDRIPL